jgi:hypothetical protein
MVDLTASLWDVTVNIAKEIYLTIYYVNIHDQIYVQWLRYRVCLGTCCSQPSTIWTSHFFLNCKRFNVFFVNDSNYMWISYIYTKCNKIKYVIMYVQQVTCKWLVTQCATWINRSPKSWHTYDAHPILFVSQLGSSCFHEILTLSSKCWNNIFKHTTITHWALPKPFFVHRSRKFLACNFNWNIIKELNMYDLQQLQEWGHWLTSWWCFLLIWLSFKILILNFL